MASKHRGKFGNYIVFLILPRSMATFSNICFRECQQRSSPHRSDHLPPSHTPECFHERKMVKNTRALRPTLWGRNRSSYLGSTGVGVDKSVTLFVCSWKLVACWVVESVYPRGACNECAMLATCPTNVFCVGCADLSATGRGIST